MFNQQEYINNFIRDNYKTIKVRIRNDDKLVINKINSVDNVNKYIYNLILKDIRENKKYHFIDNDVFIDFPLSKNLSDLTEKAEYADAINDYELYKDAIKEINIQAKKERKEKILTESKLKKIVFRYSDSYFGLKD